MQTFIDTVTDKIWAFDIDVSVSNESGAYVFATSAGMILATPPTLKPYVAIPPTADQIASQDAMRSAQAMLGSGLTVTSAATPGINGTYACDPLSQMDIIAIETSINAGKGFPGGASVFNYPDVAGVMHAFTEANFTNFAAAIRDYVYALKSVIGGATTVIPGAATPIA